MREKLNDNPVAQIVVIGILLAAAGVFAMSSMGGGGSEKEEGATSATPAIASATVGAELAPTEIPQPRSGVGAPPALPRSGTAAVTGTDTGVLLFIRDGGIDDRMVAGAVDRLHSLPGVATFVVPAKRIARFAAIAQSVDVNRVPALVVLRPKELDHSIPTASVHYGFQSPESVEQAVIDAGYKGRTVPYHP